MRNPQTDELAFWYLRGGLFRRPYVIPLQHDFRVLSRLAAVFQVPSAPHSLDRSEGFIRHWGVLPIDEVGSWPQVRETEGISKLQGDPERVRWCDSTQCYRGVDLQAGEVWEVARCEVPRYAVGTLERVATFLQAQPLDDGGAPDGPPFVTSMDTPLCAVPSHPTLNEDLDVRWHLRQHNGRLPSPLIAAPSQHLPICDGADGLPAQWSDWRYTWQGRYTEHHKSVLRSNVLRLFAQVSAPTPARWRVNVGGLLTVWNQTVNPYDNAIARRGVTTR